MSKVERQELDDFLAAAFEGGINYWVEAMIEVKEWPRGAEFASDVVSRGGKVYIHEEGGKVFELDAAGLKKGIRKAAQHRGLTVERFLLDYDAEDADIAVQLALFGEIRYG